MSILLWIAAALAALVLLALVLLLAPMRITASAAAPPAPRLRIGVAALWGLLPAIPVVDSDRPSSPRRERRRRKRRERRKRRGGGRGANVRKVLDALPGLFRGLLRSARFERLEVDGRFGLTDPAATGELYGALTPFLFALPASRKISLAIEPVFTGPMLEGRAEAAVRLFPGGMVASAARFAWRAFGPGR